MPNDTVWPLEPHTAAKHSILRRYLQGYYPKLARRQPRIMVVDGFAGPGVYEDGEDGSPVIALDALQEHRDFPNMRGCKFLFLFIEEREDRVDELQRILAMREVHPNVELRVRHGTFGEHVEEALAELRQSPGMPAFFTLDPFGVKGLALDTLGRLAGFRKTELLVSFMYQSTNRFRTTPEMQPHLDDFLGTRKWRQAEQFEGEERKGFLRNLYEDRLKNIGMEYVRMFEMRDQNNQPEYFLAFATHSQHGLSVMGDAMWKADQARGAAFSDHSAPKPEQGMLFQPEPDFLQLKTLLLAHFAGQVRVPIGEVEQFALVQARFRETHGKKIVLEAEREGLVRIQRPPGRSGSYLNVGTLVTFLPPE